MLTVEPWPDPSVHPLRGQDHAQEVGHKSLSLPASLEELKGIFQGHAQAVSNAMSGVLNSCGFLLSCLQEIADGEDEEEEEEEEGPPSDYDEDGMLIATLQSFHDLRRISGGQGNLPGTAGQHCMHSYEGQRGSFACLSLCTSVGKAAVPENEI